MALKLTIYRKLIQKGSMQNPEVGSSYFSFKLWHWWKYSIYTSWIFYQYFVLHSL